MSQSKQENQNMVKINNINIKQMIKVQPERYIVFQCEDDEPMGEIRVTMIINKNMNLSIPQLWYELMCTNKENYKVSNCKGKLDKSSSTFVKIYIKNIDNLEKCLTDKFRLRVYDQNDPKQTIIETKLKVLIQKHKLISKTDQISNNITQAVSRTSSIYSAPSLYNNPSFLTSTAASDIRSVVYYSRLLATQQGKFSIRQNQQNLNDFKEAFDDSSRKLFNKNKELRTAENNFQKNKAKQKVCFGLLILIFLFSILFGFLIKRAVNSEVWPNLPDFIKFQYFN